MSQNNDELMHYGVPGMRWGKGRKTPIVPVKNRTHKIKNQSQISYKPKSQSKTNKKARANEKKKVASIISKIGKNTLALAQVAGNNTETVKNAQKTANYINLASQMSPEYRKRYMYR